MAPLENVRISGTREQQVLRTVPTRCAEPGEFGLTLDGTPRAQWAVVLVNAYLADRG